MSPICCSSSASRILAIAAAARRPAPASDQRADATRRVGGALPSKHLDVAARASLGPPGRHEPMRTTAPSRNAGSALHRATRGAASPSARRGPTTMIGGGVGGIASASASVRPGAHVEPCLLEDSSGSVPAGRRRHPGRTGAPASDRARAGSPRAGASAHRLAQEIGSRRAPASARARPSPSGAGPGWPACRDLS